MYSVYWFLLYVIPGYVQASEKQMDKLLPGVHFGRLATAAMVLYGLACKTPRPI